MSKRPQAPRRKPTSRRRRALGQHFLSSAPAARRLVDLFAPAPSDTIIEIGPGGGALTGPLLDSGARVVAIEVDAGLVDRLRARFGGHPRLTLVHQDVLQADLPSLSAPGRARVLANLPYAITGEVLLALFRSAPALTDMMLMLQREVVHRIVADPGGRVYGSLSVLSQYFTEPRVVMTLSPASFSPPPAVSSAVVAMPFRPRRELEPDAERAYPAFIRLVFAHRRRTLLNNVRGALAIDDPAAAIARAGIDPVRRPETLSREEFLRLYEVLSA